nr:PREDICTED: gonadotropin-releasing hormone II receptor-like [Struthio camelus australis]
MDSGFECPAWITVWISVCVCYHSGETATEGSCRQRLDVNSLYRKTLWTRLKNQDQLAKAALKISRPDLTRWKYLDRNSSPWPDQDDECAPGNTAVWELGQPCAGASFRHKGKKQLLNFLKLFAMYAAALVLVVISLDRHAAVLRPFAFAGARRRNKLLLYAAWAASVLLASPQLFLFHLHTIPGVNFTQCVTHGSFQEHWEETVYNMFTFTTLYITPLSVMIICYIRIIWEISKQLKINKGLIRSKNDHISKARMKTLKMTIVIVATFIICWTPYYLLGLWYWFQPDMIQRMPDYINHSFFLFGLLHTCTDPVIYGLYTPSFREDMQLCLRGIETAITRQERPKPVSGSEKNNKDDAVNGGVASGGSNGTTVHTVC